MESGAPDLVDVLAFVRVAETGSFARAAERMGLSKPVLSRRVVAITSTALLQWGLLRSRIAHAWRWPVVAIAGSYVLQWLIDPRRWSFWPAVLAILALAAAEAWVLRAGGVRRAFAA